MRRSRNGFSLPVALARRRGLQTRSGPTENSGNCQAHVVAQLDPPDSHLQLPDASQPVGTAARAAGSGGWGGAAGLNGRPDHRFVQLRAVSTLGIAASGGPDRAPHVCMGCSLCQTSLQVGHSPLVHLSPSHPTLRNGRSRLPPAPLPTLALPRARAGSLAPQIYSLAALRLL